MLSLSKYDHLETILFYKINVKPIVVLNVTKCPRFLHVCRFRPQFIHKYTLNSQSIYSAVSVGLSGHLILKKLSIFSKLEIPPSVVKFVTMTAEACGKVQLALSKGRYYLESVSKDALLVLLREPGGLVVEAARKVLGGARLSPEELIKSVRNLFLLLYIFNANCVCFCCASTLTILF